MKSIKYLQPNNIYSYLNFEEYCDQIVPEFYFKEDVPEEVIQNFEVVEKLIAFGYYEHKFIDAAFSNSLVTFEMAMKIKANALNCYKNGDMFNALITKLSKLNLFDTSFEELKRIKETRNLFSHPENHSYGGVTFVTRIQSICSLINELYDNVELRIQRNSLKENFTKKQKELNIQYGLKLESKTQNLILFNLHLVFVNNKTFPITYDLTFSPITDFKLKNESSYKQPQIFHAKCIDPEFKNDSLTVTHLETKEKIKFTSVQYDKLAGYDFESWKSNLLKKEDGFLIDSYISSGNHDILIKEMDLFHKMK